VQFFGRRQTVPVQFFGRRQTEPISTSCPSRKFHPAIKFLHLREVTPILSAHFITLIAPLIRCPSPKPNPACIFNIFVMPLAVHTGGEVHRLQRSRSLVPTPAAALPLVPAHPWQAINEFAIGDNTQNRISDDMDNVVVDFSSALPRVPGHQQNKKFTATDAMRCLLQCLRGAGGGWDIWRDELPRQSADPRGWDFDPLNCFANVSSM